jgi:hypothetical protein
MRSYKVKDVTQPRDSGSTTVFSNDEFLIPRPRRHRLLMLLLQPFTSMNSTSACCPSTPMCVTACANCITHASSCMFKQTRLRLGQFHEHLDSVTADGGVHALAGARAAGVLAPRHVAAAVVHE